MKNIYNSATIGLVAIKENNIAKIKNMFINIYSNLVRSINTNVDEDEMVEICKTIYLFVSKAITVIPDNVFHEMSIRGHIARIQLIVNAKDAFKKIVEEALSDTLPDHMDPLYQTMCLDIFEKFEVAAYMIDIRYCANLVHALPEWQRLYNKYGSDIKKKLGTEGESIHNKVVEYLESTNR